MKFSKFCFCNRNCYSLIAVFHIIFCTWISQNSLNPKFHPVSMNGMIASSAFTGIVSFIITLCIRNWLLRFCWKAGIKIILDLEMKFSKYHLQEKSISCSVKVVNNPYFYSNKYYKLEIFSILHPFFSLKKVKVFP